MEMKRPAILPGDRRMHPITQRVQDDVLIVLHDDPTSVNDGQADVYRKSLYDTVQSHPPAPPRVVVDLRPIDFLSSSGIALLIGLKRRVDSAKGKLVLANVQPYVL